MMEKIPIPLTETKLRAVGMTIPEVRYREDIEQFEAMDRRCPPPQAGVLFVGDSDIRLWSKVGKFEESFGDLPAVNRGFGGARTWETLLYFPELVFPSRPRMIVYCAGDNDIAKLKSETGVENAVTGFEVFLKLVKAHTPFVCKVLYMGIHPSPRDEPLWGLITKANIRLRACCARSGLAKFVDYSNLLLDASGRPQADAFVHDQLHFSEKFYQKLGLYFRGIIDAELVS